LSRSARSPRTRSWDRRADFAPARRVHPFRHDSQLIPTFHPAYLLRSPERKRDVWEDMKKVRDLLASAP
jgi:uracil-DNA glycosylase family 4